MVTSPAATQVKIYISSMRSSSSNSVHPSVVLSFIELEPQHSTMNDSRTVPRKIKTIKFTEMYTPSYAVT
jgi:hypothetical protein